MVNAYTIPVAFLVEGDDEDAAAMRLTEILDDANLTQDHRHQGRVVDGEPVDGLPLDSPDLGPIESWWLPNHPNWDGADIEQVLVFHPGTDNVADIDEVMKRYNESPAFLIVMNALPKDRVFPLAEIRPIVEWLERSPEAMLMLSRLGDKLHDAGLLRD